MIIYSFIILESKVVYGFRFDFLEVEFKIRILVYMVYCRGREVFLRKGE